MSDCITQTFPDAIQQALQQIAMNIPSDDELKALPPNKLEGTLAEWADIDKQLAISMDETLFWLNRKIKSLKLLKELK